MDDNLTYKTKKLCVFCKKPRGEEAVGPLCGNCHPLYALDIVDGTITIKYCAKSDKLSWKFQGDNKFTVTQGIYMLSDVLFEIWGDDDLEGLLKYITQTAALVRGGKEWETGVKAIALLDD